MKRMDPTDLRMLEEVLAQAQEDETRFRVSVFQAWKDVGHSLSVKQRMWLHDVYEKVVGTPVYENLVSNGRVPRGKEVESLVRDKPLKPPGRVVG